MCAELQAINWHQILGWNINQLDDSHPLCGTFSDSAAQSQVGVDLCFFTMPLPLPLPLPPCCCDLRASCLSGSGLRRSEKLSKIGSMFPAETTRTLPHSHRTSLSCATVHPQHTPLRSKSVHQEKPASPLPPPPGETQRVYQMFRASRKNQLGNQFEPLYRLFAAQYP